MTTDVLAATAVVGALLPAGGVSRIRCGTARPGNRFPRRYQQPAADTPSDGASTSGDHEVLREGTVNQHQNVQPVQNPLTLIMKAKCAASAAGLRRLIEHIQSLPDDENPITIALNKLGTVHFARFVFIDDDRLAVITTYDGSFEDYINEFVNEVGHIFNKILSFVENAPPVPVQAHRQEFIEYIMAHDLRAVGTLYSSYPRHTVLELQNAIGVTGLI
jgi:hypothetical protein